MKILAMNVDWKQGWANTPNLEILVDELPNTNDLVYSRDERTPNLIYGYVSNTAIKSYILMGEENSTSPHRGFGGARFTRKLDNGSEITSNNCWSSRASCLTIPSVDCYLRERNTESIRGNFAIDLDALNDFLLKQDISSFFIVPQYNPNSDETVYVPSIYHDRYEKPESNITLTSIEIRETV